MSKEVLIIGAGAVGLSCALHCARKGHRVTVIERNGASRDGCSFGNAGMIVPSHFVPLAAPGMVKLGLKWMWNPESPFYIKPRLDGELFDWAIKFWRAANTEHVRRSAPLIRDLSFTSRAMFEEIAAQTQNEIGLVTRGLLMLCQTQYGLDDEAKYAVANKLCVCTTPPIFGNARNKTKCVGVSELGFKFPSTTFPSASDTTTMCLGFMPS